jgi:hypothetical protein
MGSRKSFPSSHVWGALNRLKRAMREERPGLWCDRLPRLQLPPGQNGPQAGIPSFISSAPDLGLAAGPGQKVWPDCWTGWWWCSLLNPTFPKLRHRRPFRGPPLLDAMEPPRPRCEAKIELGLDPERPLLALSPAAAKHWSANCCRHDGRRGHPAPATSGAETWPWLWPIRWTTIFYSRFWEPPARISSHRRRSHLLQNAADMAWWLPAPPAWKRPSC